MGSLFVVGISAWYILKNKDVIWAKKSLVVGVTFGVITSLFLIFSGDEAAHQVALTQPTKLARWKDFIVEKIEQELLL